MGLGVQTYIRTCTEGGWTDIRTDSHMTTKIFEIDGLTNFLRYGALLACLQHTGAPLQWTVHVVFFQGCKQSRAQPLLIQLKADVACLGVVNLCVKFVKIQHFYWVLPSLTWYAPPKNFSDQSCFHELPRCSEVNNAFISSCFPSYFDLLSHCLFLLNILSLYPAMHE